MKIECKQGRRQRWHFRLHRESDNKLCAVSPMSGNTTGFASAKDADAAANEVLEARAGPLRDVIKTLQESIDSMRRAQNLRLKEMQEVIDRERKRMGRWTLLGAVIGFVAGGLVVHFG